MELSCETVRNTEDGRPTSSKFVELHVLYVPDDHWDVKLNKVPAEAIERFISAGFIRVYPDVTLETLRGQLGSLLGADRNMDKFSFLKCVGRSLALVKSKQESDLKVKTFALPYAPQPELYLLPAVENDSSVCSRSLISETSSSSPDHQNYYHPPKMCSMPAGTKKAIKFPLIPRCSHQPPPTQSLEEEEEEEEENEEEEDDEEEEEEEGEQSFSSSEAEGEHREEGLSSNNFKWAEQECRQNQRAAQSVTLNKALQQDDTESAHVKNSAKKEERKRNQQQKKKRAPRDSEETLFDNGGSDFSLAERFGNIKDASTPGSIKTKPATEVTECAAASGRPLRCITSCSGPPSAAIAEKPAASPGCHKNREELIEEIMLVRGERKQLEWTRQELLRKGKDLLSQNRHRRNQARNSWKKKYFETKKNTFPLEEKLRGLQQQLEMFYNKLLQQLQAREHRGKQRQHGRASIKNELIIQIMTETHEIDTLKRKIEDAKMKLTTEIRLRKQAATELRALKVELAQKKSHTQPL